MDETKFTPIKRLDTQLRVDEEEVYRIFGGCLPVGHAREEPTKPLSDQRDKRVSVAYFHLPFKQKIRSVVKFLSCL
ncbi:MAG: hypothetical protein GX357_01775 [Firmicutes bacterium]|nr:hypothetical protein [Bacillota bacterium]